VGGGVYMPPPETLLGIRNHIAEKHQELRRILRAAAVKKLLGELQGEQLTRVPKGFAADHPAADLLRHKRFILYVELPAELATTKEFHGEVLQRFKAMLPFIRFLTAPRKTSRKKDQGFPLNQFSA
jgi:uncharacterized protein (TIGR02453 family)